MVQGKKNTRAPRAGTPGDGLRTHPGQAVNPLMERCPPVGSSTLVSTQDVHRRQGRGREMRDVDGELDFPSFREYSMAELGEEFEGTDLRPTDLVIMLNRTAGIGMRMAEGRVHRPRGLSWNAFKVLYILWMVGDREQHRVSALGGMSRATASAVVKTLVRSGYVVQVPSEVDKRTHLLALTETGQEVIREVFVEQNDLLTDWSNRLTHTEQDILKMLLTKLMGDSS